MLVKENILSGKRKYGFVLLTLLFISLVCLAFSISGNEDFDMARREILLRRIGHEILLQSGDSTSRVLPVTKIAKHEYQLRFENELSFEPQFLVNTTRRLMATDPLAGDYVVNVLNCFNNSIAYGFAVSQNKQDDIVACMGRKQPRACYLINIKFKPAASASTSAWYILIPLLALSIAGFIFLKRDKQPETTSDSPDLPGTPDPDLFNLGSIIFNTNTRQLITAEKSIDLTKTETRVLRIFALSPNEIIERSRLQKEIWEDEGVIVGRSLDMFISKLRKKLEADPDVNIVVIRGKGYKLEMA